MIWEIIGAVIMFTCLSGATIIVFADTYLLNSSPLDDNILMLIGRILFIPVYVSLIPAGVLVVIYHFSSKLYYILKERGVIGAIANFFNKKPLEFLKNYSIKIEKK